MQTSSKTRYIKPRIVTVKVISEASIAVGSANLIPFGSNGSYHIDENWTEEKFTQDVNW